MTFQRGRRSSLPSSTPLILVDPRAVSKEAPVSAACTQGAPNGTAGIRGISRFLRGTDAAATTVSIERSIDRSNERTSLGNFPITRRGSARRLARGRKTRGGGKRERTIVGNARCGICGINVEIYAFSRVAYTRRIADTRRAEAVNALFILPASKSYISIYVPLDSNGEKCSFLLK